MWPVLWNDTLRRSAAVASALTLGRPGFFHPRAPAWWDGGGDGQPGLYDTAALARTLTTSVDEDRLNGGAMRYCATAVDIETGEDAVFDTADRRIDARHIRASGALPPVFPPVEVDGRVYVDGGLSANLALDPVLCASDGGRTLVLALDLLPLTAERPRTVGDLAGRAQDLIFAAQSRRSLAWWREVARYRREMDNTTVVRLSYAGQAGEIAAKPFDFSRAAIEQRWAAGRARMEALLARWEGRELTIGAGLRIVDADEGGSPA